jgi:hypothetical protein
MTVKVLDFLQTFLRQFWRNCWLGVAPSTVHCEGSSRDFAGICLLGFLSSYSSKILACKEQSCWLEQAEIRWSFRGGGWRSIFRIRRNGCFFVLLHFRIFAFFTIIYGLGGYWGV